ncbi:MAG TPA: radical SAM protein, partial [Candidatus Methylomirabilis sp.]|nr:radical SAM protein [Candidatus Methylomirabilis sp.]
MGELQQRELLSLSNEQLSEILESLAQPPYRLRQLLDGLCRQRWSRLDQFSTLPQALRRQLADLGYSLGLPAIEKKFTSTDGTIRYLFAFSDGQSVETVWMPEGDGGEAGDGSPSGDEELSDLSPELSSRGRAATEGSAVTGDRRPPAGDYARATICVSSQVGCAVDCKFCMTALLGLHRNLTAGEITGQVLAVLNDQRVDIDRDRINLVFMGQGEPFLNYDNFMQAVRRLSLDAGIPTSRMTVSTSGIVPRIADFGAEEIRPKLAVSLNASNEALRSEVMPITRKW